VSTVGTHVGSDLVDQMMELYCDWRTECGEVRTTYDRFLDASAPDRAAAFAAYTAALDREESACQSYAAQVRLLESRLEAAGTRTGRRATSRPDQRR
jgi:hypothetical protein